MTGEGEAVKEIAKLAQEAITAPTTITTIDGVPRGVKQLVDLRLKVAEPAALKVSTLSAFAGYVNANKDEIALEKCIVHVEDESTVTLRGPLVGTFAQRLTYIQADAPNRLGNAFEFGRWMSHMDMILSLQTLFTEGSTESLLLILKAVSVNSSVVSRDGGAAQSIEIKTGIEMVENVDIPNPVMLQPFRTFSEIEQPVSPFVLRTRIKTKDGQPVPNTLEFALFEADGGAWKETAVQRIVSKLDELINAGEDDSVTIIG